MLITHLACSHTQFEQVRWSLHSNAAPWQVVAALMLFWIPFKNTSVKWKHFIKTSQICNGPVATGVITHTGCEEISNLGQSGRSAKLTTHLYLQLGDHELASGDWREGEVLFPL
jgi:hypothetical protein